MHHCSLELQDKILIITHQGLQKQLYLLLLLIQLHNSLHIWHFNLVVLSIQVRFHDFGLPIFKVLEHPLWCLEVQSLFDVFECFSFSFDAKMTVILNSNSFSVFIFTE